MYNYEIVMLPNGTALTQQNKLCLQNKIDGNVIFVEINEEVMQTFGIVTAQYEVDEENIGCENINVVLAPEDGSSNNDDEPSSSTRVWTKNAVSTLINVIQTFDKRFKSTTEKNERVWQAVAEEMVKNNIQVTSNQCRDKWKYLKMRYMKKKDNMSSRQNGMQAIKFEFFEEMDEFLSHRHNVKPIALAASLEGDTVPDHQDNEYVLEEEKTPVKRRLSRKRKEDLLETLVDEIKQSSKSREEHRQAQLRAKEEAIKVFSNKMDELIKALTPK